MAGKLFTILAGGVLALSSAAPVSAGPAPREAEDEGGYRPGTMGWEFRRYKDRMADMVDKGAVVLGRMADRMANVIDAEIDGYKRGDSRDQAPAARGEAADKAADICSDAAQRKVNGHAGTISSVDRDGDGWRVEGMVSSGRGDQRPFVCGVHAGKVDYVELGDAGDLG